VVHTAADLVTFNILKGNRMCNTDYFNLFYKTEITELHTENLKVRHKTANYLQHCQNIILKNISVNLILLKQ